jgi:hypothetical protein
MLRFTDIHFLFIFSYLVALETEFAWFILTNQTHF